MSRVWDIMTFKTRSRLSQAEPISVIVLVGAVIAIALAVYGYFASQAAIASYRQRIQAEIAKLKFNTVINELYNNDTDRYVLIKRLDTDTARITFSIVLGEFYGDTLLIYDTLTDETQIYLLTLNDGLYEPSEISVTRFTPLNRLYVSVETPLYSGYLRGQGVTSIPVYELKATQKPGAQGCDLLLDVKLPPTTGNGYPMIIIIESIGEEYYIVDTYQFPKVSTT